MVGWIKIFNKFLLWEWFDKAEMVQLFLYLLLNANYKDNTWRGVKVKRGELLTSRDKISKDLGLTERQVRTCLKRLQATGEITIKATNRYSIITICKYGEYQSDEGDVRPTERPINDLPCDRQTTDKATDKATCGTTTLTEEQNNIYKETSLKRGKEIGAAAAAPTTVSDETKAEKLEKLPAKEIKDMWNDICKGFPRLMTISENRKNKMRLRITEMGGTEKAMQVLKTIFEKMQASSFLKGDNKRGWKASFDWIFENDKNWVKVYEGNYDNKPEQQNPSRYTNTKNCNDEWT